MHKSNLYVIGLMSGTSLDGLDLLYARFTSDDYANYEIIECHTYTYSKEWEQKLKKGVHTSQEELAILDRDYGILIGEMVNEFLREYGISKVDFIASHGHTIFHQPEKGITLQIGNGQEIANKTKCKVICDFRTQDVRLGGQGAPLVPIGDRLLFSEYDACINLGGFANISFEQGGRRIAFDICPVNVVLNHLSLELKWNYDHNGILSSKGNVKNKILNKLNQLEFYDLKPPKSLGIEWVHESVFPILKPYTHIHKVSENITTYDLMRTFVEHIAIQISHHINDFNKVLFTGGGVYNNLLMSRVFALSSANIVIPESTTVNYKEALIFALLGLLKLKNRINCLASVTGAEKNHSSGRIFNPNNDE